MDKTADIVSRISLDFIEHAARISDYITIFTFFQTLFEKTLPKLGKLTMMIIILTYCMYSSYGCWLSKG